MRRHAAILQQLGGYQVVADTLGLQRNTVGRWRERGIPYRYWHYIIEMMPGLTAAQLERTKPTGVQARRGS